jgi:hypothetical protein
MEKDLDTEDLIMILLVEVCVATLQKKVVIGPMGGGKNETGRDPSAQFKGLPPGYKTSEKAKAALEAQRQGTQRNYKNNKEKTLLHRT